MVETIVGGTVPAPVVAEPVVVKVDPPAPNPAAVLFPEKKEEVVDATKQVDKDGKPLDDAAKAKIAEEAAAKVKADEAIAAEKKAAEEKAAKEYTVKSPEGVELEPASLTEFTSVSKEAGLSAEQAQALVNWYGKNALTKANEQAKTWETTNAKWVEQAKTDKEFGGDKFTKSVDTAKQAIAKYGTPEFNEALALTGMGNHPEMIRFLSRVGKAFAEDGMKDGKPLGGATVSAAKLLFPNQN